MDNHINEFVNLVKNYNDLYSKIESEKRFFGKVELYPTQIHTLVYIKNNNQSTFTNIANDLKVTKGALTKTINKLLEKKLIEKYHPKNNKKSVLYFITPLGNAVCKKHDEFHKEFNWKISNETINFLIENEKVIKQLFQYINKEIDCLRNKVKKLKGM